MNWTQDQRKIIDARECNLLVSAAAGSGKTAVLVERIIQMISDQDNPINIDELLVVTFTKAAASQMKEKIRLAMEKLVEENPDNIHFHNQIHLLNQANILTIDSFCYKVVKEHFYALGIDPGIRVGDAGELTLLKKEIMDTVIEEHYHNDTDFVAFSDAYCNDKSDERLSDFINNVYEVSSSFPRPDIWIKEACEDLCISSEDKFMELLYVKKYCDEVKNVATHIKHIILNLLEIARGIDGPLYMEKALLDDISMVDDIISAKSYSQYHGLCERKFMNIGRGKEGTYQKELAETIKKSRDKYKDELKNKLKVFSVSFADMQAQMTEQNKMLEALLNVTEDFRHAYLTAKMEKNVLEFSDVEHLALEVLCDGYDELGTPIPSRIGKEMADYYYEIMIDEYQDSNFLQEAILSCVSKTYKNQYNIFMVGDVKQSIYRFRMARPDLFMDKYHTYQDAANAPKRKLLLKNNFRSRYNVLQCTNYIFNQIMGSDLGGIAYTEDEALVPTREFPVYDKDYVELMIGESKDFVDCSNEIESDAKLSLKQEKLDENLEDIEKKELEATMIANKICELLGKGEGSPYQVTDDATGLLRDISYKDIVILLRAPSGYSDIFSEVLMNREIPVRVQNEAGFLDTVEIHQVLSLLRTVDNPFHEIELVATLRSFFGGFTNEELAQLVILKKHFESACNEKLFLYETIMKIISMNPKEMSEKTINLNIDIHSLFLKCKKIIDLITELRINSGYMSVSQLVQNIYYQNNYYYYVQAMPEGKERMRNMDLFMEEILRYEENSYHSLFEFLQYMNDIIDNRISLGGDPSMDGDSDVVRIMSIHKSKGLEFPVVFVSGMGKQFNLQDSKDSLVIHSDYHLGAKYVNPQKRCGTDSFTRQVFASLIRTESIAEELRILYVALTRAKEKLIMTGVVGDIPKLIHQFEQIGNIREEKIGFANVHCANSYLDFIVSALIRNKSFHDGIQKIQPRIDQKTLETITGDYECKYYISNPAFDLAVSVFDYRSIVMNHVVNFIEDDMERLKQKNRWEKEWDDKEKTYEENFAFQYFNQAMTKQKTKLSVTEIKRMYENELQDEMGGNKTELFGDKIPVPDFMKKENVLSATQKGTYIHKAMELLDFQVVNSKESVEEWMEIVTERLGVDAHQILTADNILCFLNSDLGKRIIKAQERDMLYKERKFVVGVPVSKLGLRDEVFPDDQLVVVQGIIDLYFEEDDKIVLVDYKTDHIKPGMEEEVVKRYKTQMQYYKYTLEQLLSKSVSETYLYSFALNKALRVF